MKKNEILKGGPQPTVNIYLGRISYGDIHSVKNWLKASDVKSYNIDIVSHKDAKFKSFKIEIPKYNLNSVLDPEFWPRGVICKVWRGGHSSESNKRYKSHRFITQIFLKKIHYFLNNKVYYKLCILQT